METAKAALSFSIFFTEILQNIMTIISRIIPTSNIKTKISNSLFLIIVADKKESPKNTISEGNSHIALTNCVTDVSRLMNNLSKKMTINKIIGTTISNRNTYLLNTLILYVFIKMSSRTDKRNI